MLLNLTEKAIYLDKDGKAVEAGPDAATLLVAPGGSLDEAEAARYGVADRLTPHADADLKNPVTGEPIALVGGRAFARHLVEGANPRRAESKHVAGPQETKGVDAPAPAVAPEAPAAHAKAAGLDAPPKQADKK